MMLQLQLFFFLILEVFSRELDFSQAERKIYLEGQVQVPLGFQPSAYGLRDPLLSVLTFCFSFSFVSYMD